MTCFNDNFKTTVCVCVCDMLVATATIFDRYVLILPFNKYTNGRKELRRHILEMILPELELLLKKGIVCIQFLLFGISTGNRPQRENTSGKERDGSGARFCDSSDRYLSGASTWIRTALDSTVCNHRGIWPASERGGFSLPRHCRQPEFKCHSAIKYVLLRQN